MKRKFFLETENSTLFIKDKKKTLYTNHVSFINVNFFVVHSDVNGYYVEVVVQ
jgi:hypothetical protein